MHYKSNGLSKEALSLTPNRLKTAYKIYKSDAKLAKVYKCSEAYIQQHRASWGIKTILNGTGREGELAVLRQLKKTYGSTKIEDMNAKDPHALYDILLDGNIRIEVKASKVYEKLSTWSKSTKVDRYYAYHTFMLMDDGRKSLKSLASYKTRKAGTTLTRKNYAKTCDYLVCVAFDEEKKPEFYLVFPADEIPKTNAVNVYRNFNCKHDNYFNPSVDLSLAGMLTRTPQYMPKERICKKCGKKFTYVSNPGRYCPKCKKEISDAYKKQWYRENKKRILTERRKNNGAL